MSEEADAGRTGLAKGDAVIDRVKTHLSYANVMATVAVFIALGGTSYAALKLPRNSVGTDQLRTGAVRSSDVKDRSLGVRDLSVSARSSLRGAAGPAGPVGPQGPAGAPASRFFSAVSASGALLRGTATDGGRNGAIGNYVVGFAQNVSGCAYSATLGSTDSSAVGAGRAAVSDLNGKVGVQTFDAAGSPADLPFHLVVVC